MPSIVAIDIETTGLDPHTDAITEIGAVRFNGHRIEDEWSTLVNPGKPIPPFITQLTGITDQMVRISVGIEDWRDLLARNIAIRNPDLSQRELNFAVQRTIDRIVFLRICEDRGIEEYGRLQTQLNGTNVYKRLVQLFSQADDRYNSGLFHFQREKERHEEPDKLTPNISIDDKPLKDIINRLYYPESPYEFSVLSADILGQVYEQFLGKVIRLTAGHQAKVEEKPEVRKAGDEPGGRLWCGHGGSDSKALTTTTRRSQRKDNSFPFLVVPVVIVVVIIIFYLCA